MHCDVVNVQPRFNFSDEITKYSNLELCISPSTTRAASAVTLMKASMSPTDGMKSGMNGFSLWSSSMDWGVYLQPHSTVTDGDNHTAL